MTDVGKEAGLFVVNFVDFEPEGRHEGVENVDDLGLIDLGLDEQIQDLNDVDFSFQVFPLQQLIKFPQSLLDLLGLDQKHHEVRVVH